MTPSSAKVALVTGAARGIGLAAAERFLKDGWSVAMLDYNHETLAATIKALNLPERVLALPYDVSKPADVAAAVAATKARFGRIDALVNNAGIAEFAPMMETSLETWLAILGTNLTGPFMMSQAVVPVMEQTGGAIVNITSISGVRASTLRVAYGTSKAGLAHLTKQMAVELGNRGIRVNAVAPGPVETEMAKKVHDHFIRADYHDVIPLDRYADPEELANVILFLCSPQASYITGQVLAVDGGFSATGVGLPTLRRTQGNG
jgi:NAD(P)-dependent dehydrogenase (short-subunit alcohol dehydrogenase family)